MSTDLLAIVVDVDALLWKLSILGNTKAKYCRRKLERVWRNQVPTNDWETVHEAN
jgi:hypothetical protein